MNDHKTTIPKKSNWLIWVLGIYSFTLTVLITSAVLYDPDSLAVPLELDRDAYLNSMESDVESDLSNKFLSAIDKMKKACREEGMEGRDKYYEPLSYLGEAWESEERLTKGEVRILLDKVHVAEVVWAEYRDSVNPK
ncbi:MAG: hypothetical protein COA79_22390 [Planctomycetota bacterium]|nr:MAG: hypothetical protein COA79_22390 [Planctomycetota bacterium]